MNDTPVTVGVLGLHESKETKAILNAVDGLGHEPVWLRRENIAVHITGDEIRVQPDIDVVANRLLLSNTDQPAEELGLAAIYEDIRPVLNPPAAVFKALHKFAGMTSLAANGIALPESLLALNYDLLNAERDVFGDEAVYKTAIGTHGGGTWRIALDEPVQPMAGERHAFLQAFIDIGADRQHDYRVYVVDGDVIGTVKRFSPRGEWRTNVHFGGEVEDATDAVPESVAVIAQQATDTLGLDYAGVDIIHDGGDWYVLEVNPTAGFRGFYKATGTSPAPYIARLAIERAGGSVDDEQVDALAQTLDDSDPRGMPDEVVGGQKPPYVIGYTERVTVGGATGTETVVAKADTGAARTSIDLELASKIGAGPIKSTAAVRTGAAKGTKSRPVVDLVVGVGGRWHTVSASIEDRSHMSYPVLLGRDVLKHYHVDVTQIEE